jgi:transposase InsO family protein
MFNVSKRSYGSPRVHADLLQAGWTVSAATVADSMRRQGLQGRKPKHSKGLTHQDRKAPKFPDLLERDFSAPAANVKWCVDELNTPSRAHPCPWPAHPSIIEEASTIRGEAHLTTSATTGARCPIPASFSAA